MPSEVVCAITGSSGYVGSCIADALAPEYRLVHLTRRQDTAGSLPWDLRSDRDLTSELRLQGAKVLVHTAWDMKANSLEELRRVCVDGSARLIDMANRAGIERIIFISTISAFEGCRSAYGKSKLAVEKLVFNAGGVVLRLGLVHGVRSGGLFGTIRKQVAASSVIPLIGSGKNPQYLLDEGTLSQALVRSVRGDFDRSTGTPILLAHPQPWPFRDLVQSLAASQKRRVFFLPVPWRVLYGGLRIAEASRIDLPVRSDSVLSFVYQDRNPDFSKLPAYRIDPAPYTPGRP